MILIILILRKYKYKEKKEIKNEISKTIKNYKVAEKGSDACKLKQREAIEMSCAIERNASTIDGYDGSPTVFDIGAMITESFLNEGIGI